MGDLLETTRRVKAGSEFVSQRLNVDEAICVRRADCPFVKTLGVEHPTFYSRYLRGNQHGPVFEILRTILRPCFKLFVVSCQRLEMPLFLLGRWPGIPQCRSAQAAIQVILSYIKI